MHWYNGGQDVDGQSAQLFCRHWLETGGDPVIARVQQYNREDVQAMLAVDRYVEAMPFPR